MRTSGDVTAEVRSLGDLGVLRLRTGDVVGAEHDFRSALARARALEEPADIAWLQVNLAQVQARHGDEEAAAKSLNEAASSDATGLLVEHANAANGILHAELASHIRRNAPG